MTRHNIESNPASKINVLKTKKNLPVFVEEKGMDILFNDIIFPDDYLGVFSKTVLLLFYNTGMRVEELVNLKTLDVDFVKLQLKVLGKRNKERLIPISKEMANQLQSYVNYRDSEVLKPTKIRE